MSDISRSKKKLFDKLYKLWTDEKFEGAYGGARNLFLNIKLEKKKGFKDLKLSQVEEFMTHIPEVTMVSSRKSQIDYRHYEIRDNYR